jgi:hypothetical protein
MVRKQMNKTIARFDTCAELSVSDERNSEVDQDPPPLELWRGNQHWMLAS